MKPMIDRSRAANKLPLGVAAAKLDKAYRQDGTVGDGDALCWAEYMQTLLRITKSLKTVVYTDGVKDFHGRYLQGL